MDRRRFNTLLDMFLINAAQMAFVEEAGGTHAYLQRLHRIFRHVTSESEAVLLREELQILSELFHLLRCSKPGLEIKVDCSCCREDVEIRRSTLIRGVLDCLDDRELPVQLELYETADELIEAYCTVEVEGEINKPERIEIDVEGSDS
jgi:hypothetical protein